MWKACDARWSSAATLLLLGGLCSELAFGQDLEPFDEKADYDYGLEAFNGAHVEVALDRAGFTWPEGGRGETVLLEIRIQRSRSDSPSIEARGGGAASSQHFEKGARGRRFLDLSRQARRVRAGDRVELRSNNIRWQIGPTALHFFANPEVADRRVLVIAPHPDDAEIAAFGVYRAARADVVTVTSGDAGGQKFEALFPDSGEHYRLKGWIRTWDSITVPFFGGIEPGRARNLGFYDATLGRMWAVQPEAVEPPLAVLEDPGFYRSLNVDETLRARPFDSTWKGLVGDLLAELERVRPEIVLAAHPLLDRHRDHQFATIALIEALEKWSGPCELYLYTNHAIHNEAFPLGPRQAMTGLPPWPGGELFAHRIYSHQLSPHEQDLKLVALEAMHDLRPFDLRDGSFEEPSRRDRRRAEKVDYFRRGPRPNEIFFVVSKASAIRLREAFLSGQADGASL